MKKIFILLDTETATRLYFNNENDRQDYCTKILNTAINCGVPVQHLPTFGTDYDCNTFILTEEPVNPTFDVKAWEIYFK